MKNYEEVTKNVFRKSEKIIARNGRRRNIIMTIGASACCLAAVCGVGAIAWNRARVSTVPVEPAAQFVSGEYANSPGASDTVVPENSGVSNGEYVISPELMAFISHTFVEGFEVEDDEKVAPDNGQIHISKALQAAMEKYGDTDENGEIIYNVVFSYLQDRQTIPSTDEIFEHETERCKEKFSYGWCIISTDGERGEKLDQTIVANLTKAEIENFTADPNYGYVLELQDNYYGYTIKEPCTGLKDHGIASKVIRGFEVEDSEEKIAPDNGQIHISKALKAAMENYSYWGDEISYYVVITYFKDRQTIPATEELYEQECARLKGQTVYGLGFETYSCDWGVHSEHWIHANFTKSQIEGFTADPNYGYVIDLYDNYHGNPITDPNDPNHVCFSYEPICGNNSANHENTHHEDDHANQVVNTNNESVHHEDDHGNQVVNTNSGNSHHNNHHG